MHLPDNPIAHMMRQLQACDAAEVARMVSSGYTPEAARYELATR